MTFSNSREFWAGLLYLAVGGFVVVVAQSYQLGTLARMGPGYFPIALGILLMLIGAACVLHSFTQQGQSVSGVAWRALFFIIAATVAFGLLLRPAGLPIALVAMIVIGSIASRVFQFDVKFVAWVLLFVAGCVALFVYGLGLSMPLLGTAF